MSTWSQRLEGQCNANRTDSKSFSFYRPHLRVRIFRFGPPFLEVGRQVGGSRLGALPSGVRPRGGGACRPPEMLIGSRPVAES